MAYETATGPVPLIENSRNVVSLPVTAEVRSLDAISDPRL